MPPTFTASVTVEHRPILKMPNIGRGGAGNIQTLADASTRISSDVEANRSLADDISSSSSTLPPREEQPYAHTGRGGSGNYYSPRELRETGRFHGSERSHILGDGTPAPAPEREVVRTYGRGGAGNFSFGVIESEERAAKLREEEDAVKREKVKQDVAKGVEDMLAVPAKAKLAGTEPY